MVIANVYSIYNLFYSGTAAEISNQKLRENLLKLMTILIPFVPHLAHECLEQLGSKNINSWPKINDSFSLDQKLK